VGNNKQNKGRVEIGRLKNILAMKNKELKVVKGNLNELK